MAETAHYLIPTPELDDPADVPFYTKALADKVDEVLYQASTAFGVLPVGSMLMWPTNVPPALWLICNGTQVDAALYPALEQVLGATGGLIALPNLASRFPLGVSPARPLGTASGAEQVTLTSAQSGIPGGVKTGLRDREQVHGHTFMPIVNGGGNSPVIGFPSAVSSPTAGPYNQGGQVLGADAPDHQHHTIATDAAQAHENMPPYLAVNFIIRAK